MSLWKWLVAISFWFFPHFKYNCPQLPDVLCLLWLVNVSFAFYSKTPKWHLFESKHWNSHRIVSINPLCRVLTFLFISRSTILVKLDIEGSRKQLAFEPGDHVAIFPANKADLVQQLINVTHDKPDPNQPIRIEVAREDSGKPPANVYGYRCLKSILCRSHYLGPVYIACVASVSSRDSSRS